MDTWLNRLMLPDEILNTASEETLWERVREVRNALLLESDWVALSDVTISNKDAWLEYRQALRDMTNVDNPFDVIIPTKPIEGGV
jgi:hypothetical protein